MALFIIRHPNPYLRNGTWVERFDDGFQECILEMEGGRAKAISHKGIVWPHATLAPFLVRVQASGFDKWGEHALG